MRTALMICLFWFAFPVFADDLPDGPGKDLVTKACTGCHGASNFSSKTNTKEDWKAVVDTMIGYGAEATPEQAEIIVTYLTKNFGKDAKVAQEPRRGRSSESAARGKFDSNPSGKIELRNPPS